MCGVVFDSGFVMSYFVSDFTIACWTHNEILDNIGTEYSFDYTCKSTLYLHTCVLDSSRVHLVDLEENTGLTLILFGPRPEKPCLRSSRPNKA